MKRILAVLLVAGLCTPALAAQKAEKKADPEAHFKKLDTNSDGKLSLDEIKGKRTGDKATKAEAQFKKLDKNNDGFVTLDEFKGGAKKKKTN